MCDCTACRTGKCSCPQCRTGPGIDFEGRDALLESLRRDIAAERVMIKDLRTPHPERQAVRRWGDTFSGAQRGDEKT